MSLRVPMLSPGLFLSPSSLSSLGSFLYRAALGGFRLSVSLCPISLLCTRSDSAVWSPAPPLPEVRTVPDSVPSFPPTAAEPRASGRTPLGTSHPLGERSPRPSRPLAAPLSVGEVWQASPLSPRSARISLLRLFISRAISAWNQLFRL